MTDIILAGEQEQSPKFERIQRFADIAPGVYVRCTTAMPDELIPEGEVLPIESIDYVDNQPHTIRLRAHPRHYGSQDTRNVKDKGWNLTTHDFRVQVFIDHFMEISYTEAMAVRAAEVAEQQGKTSDLQQEIVDTQNDPLKLQRAIAQTLEEERKAKGEPEPTTLPAVTDGLPPLTLGSALQRGVSETGIMQLTHMAQHQVKVQSAHATWLTKKTKELEKAVNAILPYYSEQAAIALATAKGKTDFVADVIDGLKSLELFIGTGVIVRRIATGQPAAKDIPLSIAQRKLIMTEEMSVFADVTENTDYRSLGRFMELCESEPALLDQIFPSERALVCMCATRGDLRYEGAHPYAALVNNLENAKVFLLARNGGNAWLISSPVESHLGAARLFPTKDETDRIFRGFDGTQITFESLKYTTKLSKFERQALHYKRLLILIAGLDHREKLFGEFHDEVDSLKLVSMEFQERYMRFIQDDDEAALLPGRERPMPVLQWMAKQNRLLTPGARVFGMWADIEANERACPGGSKVSGRVTDKPSVKIAFKGDKGPAVEIFKASGDTVRKVKAYPRRFYKGRDDIFDESLKTPYLVLDAIEPEELKFYIHDRASRVDCADYIGLFKAALRFVESERAEELPSRTSMLDAIVKANVVPADRAVEALSHAIRLWRSANNGQPLPSLEDAGSKGWNTILDTVYLIEHAASTQLERVIAFCDERQLTPVRLSVTGKAQLVLYVEPRAEERDDRLTPHAWLHRIVLRLGKRAITELSRSWEMLPVFDPTEHAIMSLGDEEHWTKVRSGFTDLKQKRALFEACEAGLSQLKGLIASPDLAAQFAEDYLRFRDNLKVVYGQVPQAAAVFPVGLYVTTDRGVLRAGVIHLGHSEAAYIAHDLLAQPAQGAFAKQELSSYANKKSRSLLLALHSDKRLLMRDLKLAILTRKGTLSLDGQPFIRDFGGFEHVTGDSPSSRLCAALERDKRDGARAWLAGGLGEDKADQLDSIFPAELSCDDSDWSFVARHTRQPKSKDISTEEWLKYAPCPEFFTLKKGIPSSITLNGYYDQSAVRACFTVQEREEAIASLLAENPELVTPTELTPRLSQLAGGDQIFLPQEFAPA